jgi:CubicO group peptidase (beta-lactamase class C family)
VMQLVERGAVALDTPVVRYLPYFRLADERSGAITVREILTHSSGMPDVANYEWDKPQYDDGALERYVRSLDSTRLLFSPGARVSYSNMAFDVLGDLIAKVSGTTVEAYVRDQILAPLGMGGSTLLSHAADPLRLARGHEQRADGSIAVSPVFPDNRIHAPSSNMLTSAKDLARWAIANMQHGELDGKRILSDTTHRLMWSPSIVESKRSNWRYKRGLGLCWVLGEYEGHPVVWHAGGDEGFVADCVMMPDEGIAVVWMINADWPKRVTLTDAALDVALNLKTD